MIFERLARTGPGQPAESGTAAPSLARSYNSALCFPKPRSCTTMTFARWNWKFNKPTQICSKTRSWLKARRKNVELADEALRLAKARLDAGAGSSIGCAQCPGAAAHPRNRRACKRYSDITPRLQNSIAPRARRARTKRCLLISRRAPRKQRPITPALGVDAEGKQSKVTMTGREFGLEDPELQIPNRLQIPNSRRWRRLRFPTTWMPFGAVTLSGAKHLGSTPSRKTKRDPSLRSG